MPETANYSRLARRPRVDTLRTLVWIEELGFQGCGCSECAWVFNPQGPPIGNSLAEMKKYYEQRRNEEYAAHACAEHPRAEKAKG